MEATIIYNTNAGGISAAEVEDLQDGLRDAGYEPVYKATSCIEDLNPILANAKGLIVSAGGDGTARPVILRLVGRDDVLFTPLPMGTANNVCRTLGIEGDPMELSWNGFPVHLDAEVHPPNFDFGDKEEDDLFHLRPYPELTVDATLHIRTLPNALQVWLPAHAEEEE
ncbi:MAG: diacylglycerol kinase family protein [Candidatus Promineifilaceae bacterium]|nr:diacylglycerol kinase family protein [Candidatus Promineifilaceae bacterium]